MVIGILIGANLEVIIALLLAYGETHHQCDPVTSQTVGQQLGELAVPVGDVDCLVVLLLRTQLGDAVT